MQHLHDAAFFSSSNAESVFVILMLTPQQLFLTSMLSMSDVLIPHILPQKPFEVKVAASRIS
jgi:hypothetical protein